MNSREQVGSMNHRIVFLTYLVGRDLYGGQTKTWLTSNEIWAALEYKEVGTDEQHLSDRTTAVTSAFFRIRSRKGITAYMRIRHDSTEYEIKGLIPQTDKRYTLIRVEATEPEQREAYWVAPDGQNWLDPDGNPWIWQGDGQNEPTKLPYISPGGFTWKDAQGQTWFQTV